MVLARTGFFSGIADLQHEVDAKWVNVCSVCSYCFILPIFIISYALGDDVPLRLVIENPVTTSTFLIKAQFVPKEMMFQFLGAVLFLTSGSLVIDRYQFIEGDNGDVGLALGSMTVITGIFMFVDFMYLAKEKFGKKA